MGGLHISHDIILYFRDISLFNFFSNSIAFNFTLLWRWNSNRVAGDIYAHSVIRNPVAKKHHKVNRAFI